MRAIVCDFPMLANFIMPSRLGFKTIFVFATLDLQPVHALTLQSIGVCDGWVQTFILLVASATVQVMEHVGEVAKLLFATTCCLGD